jgi:hypothetical protein
VFPVLGTLLGGNPSPQMRPVQVLTHRKPS